MPPSLASTTYEWFLDIRSRHWGRTYWEMLRALSVEQGLSAMVNNNNNINNNNNKQWLIIIIIITSFDRRFSHLEGVSKRFQHYYPRHWALIHSLNHLSSLVRSMQVKIKSWTFLSPWSLSKHKIYRAGKCFLNMKNTKVTHDLLCCLIYIHM